MTSGGSGRRPPATTLPGEGGTALPTGTVTFLFTDIEGSTRLVQRLGPQYREVLEKHAATVRTAVAAHGGTEVGTEGDSFFVVFGSAVDAVGAAGAIQSELAAVTWPETGAVRVRIGLHTGEGRLGGDNYLGIDVHRAARIGAVGHGGQVVVSAETHALTASGFTYVDLGLHSLKDLDAPEHLFQLLVPGLAAEFPPLRTASTGSNNLPALATTLVGRTDEAQQIGDLITTHRIVTITGPGGVGKTRLALHVAGEVLQQFSSGVFLVELAALDDADLVVPAIAAVLSVSDATVAGVARAVGDEKVLLVLDNFEQVALAAGSIAKLAGGAAGLSFLTTSRLPLHIAGEHVVRLPPLPRAHGDAGLQTAAVELFAARATAADPAFDLTVCGEDVSALVDALDGLPLAIELAAAWANLLTPRQILGRISRGVDMLTARDVDAAARHRSLATAISWSFELLDPAQRKVLRRLSIFAGGMSLEAAEAVVGTDVDALAGLADLVERSLVQRSVSDLSGSRFTMLEFIRAYAETELEESGEGVQVAARHTDFFNAMAVEASVQLDGERVSLWLAKLGEDWDNFRALLGRLYAAGDARGGFGVIGAIWRFTQSRGYITETLLWLDRFFALPGADERSAERVRALMARSALIYWQGEPVRALEGYEEAVAIARDVGDPLLLAEALYGLATSLIVSLDHEAARAPLDESKALYAAAGDKAALAHVFGGEAFNAFTHDGPTAARPMLERAVALYREVGRRVYAAQITLALAGVALFEERYADARSLAHESLDLAEEVGDQFLMAWSLEWVAAADVELGEAATGALLAGAAAAARERIGGGWTPMMVNLDDARTRATRALGDLVAAEAMAHGRGLSLDEAVELARAAADVSSGR